jgi:isopenicillin N synthase-like dioxygenase
MAVALPVIDMADLAGSRFDELNCFYLKHPLFPQQRCEQEIQSARQFFALPPEAKHTLAIERSSNFRGYSEMKNERDWREQIHFGRNTDTGRSRAVYAQLQGRNLWPPDWEWRARTLQLIADLETVGREVLGAISPDFMAADEEPYLLLKMIHYPATEGQRSGVASHADFSWITLLLQDNTGGLEVCLPEGEWVAAEPVPGTLLVNFGEILEFATRGRCASTPHRVANPSATESRISLPFFLNPALDKVVSAVDAGDPVQRVDAAHVHRVFAELPRDPFVFGEAEWRRKGLGVWCASCVSSGA